MLIFADVDGVLNHLEWIKFRGTEEGKKRREHFFSIYDHRPAIELHSLDPACLLRFRELIRSLNAKVVISSTWREGNTPEHFEFLFKELGAELPENSVIGLTPIMDEVDSFKRATEINTWLEEHGYQGEYLILDDEPMFFDDQPSYQTDHKVGLTERDVVNIKDLLA